MEDFLIIAAMVSVAAALAVLILKAKDRIFHKSKTITSAPQTPRMDIFLEIGAPALGENATSIVVAASNFLAAKTNFMTKKHMEELEKDQEKKKYFLGYCAGIPLGFIIFGDIEMENEKTFGITLWVFKISFGNANGDELFSQFANLQNEQDINTLSGWMAGQEDVKDFVLEMKTKLRNKNINTNQESESQDLKAER